MASFLIQNYNFNTKNYNFGQNFWTWWDTTFEKPHPKPLTIHEVRCVEDFFSKREDIKSEYAYLPIQWNAYHVSNGYGKNLEPLQEYLYSLVNEYPNQKWFTITQYAGGTLVKVDNCRIFSTGGGFNSPFGINSTYESIPLICDHHQGKQADNKKYKVVYDG